MRFYFRGQVFNLTFKKLRSDYGSCAYDKPRSIKITTDIKHKLLLDTLIHEALHACYPDLDEEAINQSATDIAEYLWKLGYRSEIIPPKNKKRKIKSKKK